MERRNNINEYRERLSARNASVSRNAIKRYKQSRKRKSNNAIKYISLSLVVIAIITLSIFGIIRFLQYRGEKKELEKYSATEMKQDIYIDFSVIGMKEPFPIKGLTLQDVYDKVLGSYNFNIIIKNSNPEIDIFEMPEYGEKTADENYDKYLKGQNSDNLGSGQTVDVENPLSDITIDANKDTYKLPDFLEGQLKTFIDDIYDNYLYLSKNEFDKRKVDVTSSDFVPDFKFEAYINDVYLDDSLSQLARLWDTKAVRGQIERFDTSTNEFVFGDDHKGYLIDQDELRQRIINEVNAGNLDAELWTVLNMVDANGPSVKSKYKYVSMFETWTTDNEKRNGNIKRACEGLNGYIVRPGQEFSFNKVIGQRTEEKGYDYAPAYLEGQVIEELGGGICQVSTTLYNAVFAAGLTTTYRKSHTFVPAYITPGLDATVSFYGPDYKFINDSDYSVGIRAVYDKKHIKIEIFAVPILPEGRTQNLVSTKLQDLEVPSLSIINEGKASRGSEGSEWQVFKVVKENDVEIERVFDHQTIYHGHTPTAFEENTYVDDDGVLQTIKFVETRKEEPTTESKNINSTRSSDESQTIEPSEPSNVVYELTPGGISSTGQPQ
ncbi:MAG: VanW family protein [Lachnospiraceae bacterium]|nr:VanW family protein [Lachnospiraceae bacterium]MBR1844595.1 VanW family protein [Lachnospiraceae bacterium]